MSAGSGRLAHALKALRVQWDLVEEHWNDQVRLDFEKNHMLPLETRASAAIRGMEEIAEVIKKVRQDCG